MIVVWIIIGAVVLALASWAFWPGRHGVIDGEVRRTRIINRGRIENFNNRY